MKVLGGLQPKEPEEKKEPVVKHINFTQRMKNKKRQKRLIKLAVVVVLAAVFFYVWTNAERIFEPLRGIASKIETRTSNDVGFPITLPGSAGYSFKRFGDNFSLLTDTYLYAYRTTGGQIYALRHGYSNPAQATSSRRILLYDKTAYSFAVYNRTSLIFERTVDDKIVYGTVSEDDMTAIVTNSVRYSNVIYIYDGSGDWKYTRKIADENVMQICFTDSEHIVVSTIGVDSGEIVCSYYRFWIKSGEGYEWKYSFKGNSLPCGMYADNEKIISVCDNRVIRLNTKDGSLAAEYETGGSLRDFSITSDQTAVYYNDVSTNRYIITALNSKLEPTASYTVTPAVQQIAVRDERIYVLDGNRLRIFSVDENGPFERTVSLTEDYSDFIIIGNSAYLLGYDVVAEERIE